MDRRAFLKTLASLGASIALPVDLAAATEPEIEAAWSSATQAWGLFEVNDCGTISYANFEEPRTRADAYLADVSDFGASCEVERYGSLQGRIRDHYESLLVEEADELENSGEAQRTPSPEEIWQRADDEWAEWYGGLAVDERGEVDAIIEDWLAEEPDWCTECEDFYKTGNAQGAAYDHFLTEDQDVMEALDIVVIEGECPGSSYYAAELRIPVEEANRIAAEKGWEIRFVEEGAA